MIHPSKKIFDERQSSVGSRLAKARIAADHRRKWRR